MTAPAIVRLAHAAVASARVSRAPAAALMAVVLLAAPPHARADASSPDDLLHRVAPGDTLYDIARLHLRDPSHWPQLQRANAIPDPLRLQPGRVLRIPAGLRPAQPVPAQVTFSHGAVRVRPPNAEPDREPPAAGAGLPEGSRVQVDAGGYISLRLADGSVVQVLAGSQIELERLRRQPGTRDVQSVIRLEQGRVESSVVPGSTDRLFEVRTPVVVAGVRGTRFGVSAREAGPTVGDVSEGDVVFRTLDKHARAVVLSAGEGLATTAAGQLGPPVALLPAPDLSAVPAVAERADALVLAWSPLPGASAYDVRIGTDAALQRVVRNARFDTAAARFEALPDGEYRLAVRAIDAHGIPGTAASRALRVKAHPVPPLFRAPRADAQVDGPSVTLHCTEVVGAHGYHLQLASNPDFAAPVADATGLPDCRLHLPSLPPGTYHWRAAAQVRDADGRLDRGPFSVPQRFHVVPLPEPAALATVQVGADRLELQWPPTPGLRQRVQVARDASFADLVYDDIPAQAELRLDGLAPGRYYVRLQAIDARDRAGLYSPPRVLDVGRLLRGGDGSPVRDASDGPVALP